MNSNLYDFIITGGGAAGFFCAINIAEKNPNASILILEKSKNFLDKVRISGGGRCNVTHACWEPKELVKYYPRGSKELLGPFHRFMCGDMLQWLDDHGVETNIEDDGRIFPATNMSSTIIDCFMGQAQKFNIDFSDSEGLIDFEIIDNDIHVKTNNQNTIQCKYLILAPGGSKAMWNILSQKGYQINPPVPSLFTFNIKHPLLEDLPGVSVPIAEVSIDGFKMKTKGPVLITHWGLSGPGILKLSSWAARFLADKEYEYTVKINWIDENYEKCFNSINKLKSKYGAEKILQKNIYKLPKRLWSRIINYLAIADKNIADLSKKEISKLATHLTQCPFNAKGKSTNKDEFVTSGGVNLKQINFKTMESKIHNNVYFAGEVLDIDALTGGFNFQAAWTTGWIISENIFITN